MQQIVRSTHLLSSFHRSENSFAPRLFLHTEAVARSYSGSRPMIIILVNSSINACGQGENGMKGIGRLNARNDVSVIASKVRGETVIIAWEQF